MLIGTGMRIGEVLALKRGDVDPINGVVKVINGKSGVSPDDGQADPAIHIFLYLIV